MILSSKKIRVLLPFLLALCSQCVNAGGFELHMAVRNNDSKELRAMLKLKHIREMVDVQEQETGYTPLHVAVILGRVSCGKILLNAGASPCVRDFFGRTPLAYAQALENKQIAGLIIYRLLEARWN